MLAKWILSLALACGFLCDAPGTAARAQTRLAAPSLTATPALHGAVIVTLASETTDAKIYYTVDGSKPTEKSERYLAPFLVSRNMTVRAIARARGNTLSKVAAKKFKMTIAPGTLVWSDEFANATSTNAQPDPKVWTYDIGNSGFGNHELESYCAWGSDAAPCSAARPNAYVGTDGYLHIVARQVAKGVYTSARMKTQGLFSVQYGRVEFKARVPEEQGLWPAGWLLGNNIATVRWPASGEIDVLERVNAAKTSDWNEGSIHGPGFIGDVGLGTVFSFPEGETAAGWHTYGMSLSPNSASFYVDDAAKPYVTYTNPASLKSLPGSVWPFDAGQSNFILLNMAVGGDWPKDPDATTTFPAEMLVDYVRIYAN